MQLIRQVRIEGFRSLADEKLDSIGDSTVMLGKNSSGKSNVLRALNLFFTGSPVPKMLLDFDRDHHYRPSRRQKKRISITVDFSVPSRFNLRSGLERLARLGDEFSIRKTWELDQLRNPFEVSQLFVDGVEQEGGQSLARDFLSLVVFRYIQNRTVPAELLREESQAIASAIFKKMRESSKAEDVLKNLSDSAGKLLSSSSGALVDSGAPMSKLTIATAASLGEMLSMSGFQAEGLNGKSVQDEDWGAGHQAFFLFNLLRELDTDYSRHFGWKQACIWAVEEPESGLHHDLQTRLAKTISDWSQDGARRLQIFTTTHSPVIAMSADSGYWVELTDTTSKLTSMQIGSLVRSAEDRGVTSYIHPALAFPFNPVVLVEGSIDEMVLNHVARLLGRGMLRFVSLPSLDREEGSGFDNVLAYIRRNSVLANRRSPEAPLLVLVDWEISDTQLASLQRAYGDHGSEHVVRCDANAAVKELGDSFRGIERFYPSALVRSAHNAGECVIGFPANTDRPWSVSGAELKRGKGKLAGRVCEINDLRQLSGLISVVEQVYLASTSFAKRQMSLI